MRRRTLSLAVLAFPGVAYAAQPALNPLIDRGRALSDWSSAESLAELVKAASPELKAILEKAGGPARMAEAMRTQLGKQTLVYDEFVTTLNGLTTYQRLAGAEHVPAVHSMIAWNNAGVVQAARVQPSSPPPVGKDEEVTVGLPFAKPQHGDWYTVWGGRNLARNYHMVAPDQIHAFDFVIIRDGRTYDGAAADLTSYFCWGQPVLAAEGGVVTELVDGIGDNRPVGAMNANKPAGNYVIIRHAAGVHSLSGYLKNGSTTVKVGQHVTAGQKIGLCGNSGNSSEPHVHFHLQTTGTFGSGATGLPAAFRNALVDRRSIKAGEPVRGQIISPQK